VKGWTPAVAARSAAPISTSLVVMAFQASRLHQAVGLIAPRGRAAIVPADQTADGAAQDRGSQLPDCRHGSRNLT
jgi:hypothetical protein